MINYKLLTLRIQNDEEAVKFFEDFHIKHEHMLCANGHIMILCFKRQIRWMCNKNTCRVDKGIRQSN